MHAQAFSEEFLVHVADVAGLEGLQPLAAGVASAVALPIISFRGPVGVFDFGSRNPAALTGAALSIWTVPLYLMSHTPRKIRLGDEP